MSRPISIRLGNGKVAERLQTEATARQIPASSLARQLIDEGLRMRRHPLIGFRDGPAGRRAGLIDGMDIWEVIGGIIGGDVPPPERVDRAVEEFGLRRAQAEAALSYYAEYTEEIDAEIEANLRAADEAEALWRRRQHLLSS